MNTKRTGQRARPSSWLGLAGAAILLGAAIRGQGWAADVSAAPRVRPQQEPTAIAGSRVRLFAPLTLVGSFATQAPPMASPTHMTAVPPTASPPATAVLETATPAPKGPEVLFQIATYGGLSQDLMLSYMPSMTPWFTLFEDGSYIRIVEHWIEHAGDDYRVERFTGRLDDQALAAFQRTLLVEVAFFDLPHRPEPMVCRTDLPYDRVLFASGQRRNDLLVYGLSMYASGKSRCPTPPDHRLEVLADVVAGFRQPMSTSERRYEVERGTLLATEARFWRADLPWPFPDIHLADLPDPGQGAQALALQGSRAQAVADSIIDHSSGDYVAYYLDGDKVWLVGFRVEFDGWDAYSPSFFPQSSAVGLARSSLHSCMPTTNLQGSPADHHPSADSANPSSSTAPARGPA